MFIDIHVHTRRLPGPPRIKGDKMTYATPEELLAGYDEIGIERACVLPGVNPECCYVPQANEDVLELAEKNARFIPFCNVDPRAMTNSIDAPFEWIFKYYRDRDVGASAKYAPTFPCSTPLCRPFSRGPKRPGSP